MAAFLKMTTTMTMTTTNITSRQREPEPSLSLSLATKLLVAGFLAGALCSCHTAQAEPQSAPAPAQKLGVRMPLAKYIPAPGLRWLVQLKPRVLFENQKIRKDWEPVFSSERIAAFRAASGFDPSQVEEIWIAGYDFGTLYLFDAARVGPASESSFRDRSLTTAELSTHADDVVHLTGMMNQVPHALVHLDHYLIAIAEGDIRLAKIVAAYAEGRLAHVPSALETRPAKWLGDFAEQAPIRAFAFGPFPEATDAVVSEFVGGALSVEFEQEELRLSASGRGVWPQDESLDSNLNNWLRDIFAAPELRALGWGSSLRLSDVQCMNVTEEPGKSDCSVTGAWNSAQIAQATHRITAANMGELVEGPPAH